MDVPAGVTQEEGHTGFLIHLPSAYVCMYDHHIKQSMDQPGKVANPARGQLNVENEYSPVPVRA